MTSHIPVAELADLLHRSGAQPKALVMLQAFFDESGTDGLSRIVAIAGYVTTAETWATVEAAWREHLANYGMRTFRMAACRAGRGEFSALAEDKRNSLVLGLSKILEHSDVQAIWSAVVADDWNRIVTDQPFLAVYPKPFMLCFEHVIRQLRFWSVAKAGGEPVAPVFAVQDEYNAAMKNIFEAYVASKARFDFFQSLIFMSPKHREALQAADFLVWELREHWDNRMYVRPGKDYFPHRREMMHRASAKGGMAYGGCFAEKALRLAVDDFKAGRGAFGDVAASLPS